MSLDCRDNTFPHSDGLLLNSACNALKVAVQFFKIKKLAVPYYTCGKVWQTLKLLVSEIIPYNLDNNFLPIFDNSCPILYTNYFGISDANVDYVCNQYNIVIIDNAQSFYSSPKGMATIYSPRKFFGVPDGGILFPMCERYANIKKSISWERAIPIIRRIDEGAEVAYEDFRKNEVELHNEPILLMSNLTRIMMGNIDYESTAKRRCDNYRYLHLRLHESNDYMLNLDMNAVPLYYPFFNKNINLRKKLVENKIFVPKLWNWESNVNTSPQAIKLANQLLPIPIDQRYEISDMERVVEVIMTYL